MKIAHAVVMLLGAAVAGAPAVAVPLPPPQEVFAGELVPLLPEARAVFARDPGEPEALLQKADALLAKLPPSTQARGVILMAQAAALDGLNRTAEAIHAIEESIRLLPGYSAPLYQASEIYSFAGMTGRGADLLLQASHIDPHLLREVSDYTISGLLGRLEEANDQERLTAVAERLLQVGGSSQSLTTSDRVVLAALDSRLARGDVHGARTLVPRLISPSRVVQLLTDKKYDAVRDTASAHAGPRFARLWPGYLARAETDSRSHEDGLGPRIYAQALSQAGADSRLISTFHPMFSSPIDEEQDESLIFAASPLAAALARKGRWDEALQVFESALRTWPDENNALALNLSGNRGRLLVLKGDFAAGVAQLDAVIATANQIGGQVNDAAVAAFHYYRACALHRLGRGKEAATSEGVVARRGTLDPEQVIGLHICRDNLPAAKRALMEALESEESRGDALRLVQPSDERTLASDWARQVKKAWDELRTDADVRAAALRHGYILPEPANAAVRDAGI